MSSIPRDLVAGALRVDPDSLPEGDLPVARLAARLSAYLAEAPEDPQQHPEFWTFLLFAHLVEDQGDLALDVVLACLDLATDMDVAAMIAGGPFQDLLEKQGAALVDRIETLARNDARLRLALTGISPEPGAAQPIWQRLVMAAGDSPGFDAGGPLPV